MLNVPMREVQLEMDERAGDICKSCGAPAEEGYEPYCMICASYWEDDDAGLFEESVD